MEFADESGLTRKRSPAAAIQPKRASKMGDNVNNLEDIEEQPLSPTARMFHEPNFNVHILAIMGCKTKIYTDAAKAQLPHTLLKHPRFSSLMVVDEENGGKMKWVRTEVDLDKHIVVPDLDPNMDSPEKFVDDYIYNLSKTTVDKSRPLWDIHVLNVKTSDAEAITVFRIHHSLGDGISLMSLLLACTRQTSNPEALPTVPTKKKKEARLDFNINRRIWWCLTWVWWIIKLFWNTFVDVIMLMLTAMYLEDTKTPLKGREGCGFNPRRYVYRTVSLDDMKMIKKAMNLTINDVALGITQAGLSKYLHRRYGESNNSLPNKIRLRSTLMINIRPAAGIQAIADMMEKNTKARTLSCIISNRARWGNSIGYVLLPFTIGLKEDPLDYIHDAKATIDRKKHSLEAILSFSIAELFMKFFGFKRASAISHRILSRTTMLFTNVVGPVEEIGFCGHPMAFLAPTTYGLPHALVINFQSYINKMTIVLSVDEETIPDPRRLCDDVVESLMLIKEVVIEKGLAK